MDIEPSPQPTSDDVEVMDDKQSGNDIDNDIDTEIFAESTSAGVAMGSLVDDAELNEDEDQDQETEKEKNVESEQAATFNMSIMDYVLIFCVLNV